RASQASNERCTSPLRAPLKDQKRSKDSVHITKVRAAIHGIKKPPCSIKAPMAPNTSIIACMIYLLLALSVFGNDTGGLLVENMHDAIGTTVHKGVNQNDRNRYNQAQNGGN